MRRTLPLFALAAALAMAALPAAAALVIDPSQSTLTPAVGMPQTLSGSLQVRLGDPPPLLTNTSFDVIQLEAETSGGLSIVLDPSLATPGLGVLNPSGGFLIPNLFLEIDDGTGGVLLTVPNVTGSFGALPGCPADRCLETSFAVDTGGPAGVVTVALVAIPEPGTALLLGLGLALLPARARRGGLR